HDQLPRRPPGARPPSRPARREPCLGLRGFDEAPREALTRRSERRDSESPAAAESAQEGRPAEAAAPAAAEEGRPAEAAAPDAGPADAGPAEAAAADAGPAEAGPAEAAAETGLIGFAGVLGGLVVHRVRHVFLPVRDLVRAAPPRHAAGVRDGGRQGER